MTYPEIVSAICMYSKRGIEARFAIGELVHLAFVDVGHSIFDIARDTGISSNTLQQYKDAWLFWGVDRIPDCSVWYDYLGLAQLPTRFVDAANAKERAIAGGREAVKVIWAEYDALQEAKERRKFTPEEFQAMNVRGAVRDLGVARTTLSLIDLDALDYDDRAKLAKAALAIVQWAEKLRAATPSLRSVG